MHSDDTNCFVLFMIVSETIDLFLDWDFFNEINKSSQHVDERHWNLGFAIWGTTLYVFTFVSLCCDLCNDEDKENPCSPWLSLLSTLTEDFPPIILAIVVAGHTTRLISWVQIANAFYGSFEPLTLAATFSIEKKKEKRARKH